MQLFKLNPWKPIFFFAIAILGLIMTFSEFNPSYDIVDTIVIAVSIFGIISSIYIIISYTIKTDDNGITSLYMIGSRIIKIRKHIDWEDIAQITVDSKEMPVIIPKAIQQRKLKFKDIIIISNNTKDYLSLTKLIISNAKNAIVDEKVKKLLDRKENIQTNG